MARYIDADEMLRISKEGRFMWAYDLTDLEEFLTNVPTIEARPVARGRVETVMDRFYTRHQLCSECGEELPWKSYPNFCHECGADLRGDGDETD